MRASAWWALGGALALGSTACATDTGAFCCTCVCCSKTATLTRQDQSWPDCVDPCRTYCEQQLGCHQMVTSADPCD
jgi:hypothetical protein